MQVAILGACESGRRSGVNVWQGLSATLMKYGLPAAIGMQYKVFDESAIAFSRGFYASIAMGMSLDEAVIQGRIAILNLQKMSSIDWGVPVLSMRSKEGILFSLPKQVETIEKARAETKGDSHWQQSNNSGGRQND